MSFFDKLKAWLRIIKQHATGKNAIKMNNKITQTFTVDFSYPVVFTENLFSVENPILKELLTLNEKRKIKAAFVIDSGLLAVNATLIRDIKNYFQNIQDRVVLVDPILVAQGGEESKNDTQEFQKVLALVNDAGIDRQSYIIGIGGGAILDMVGFAASIAHRGVKHIRIPTTVLSQNDSGVGVKNGINAFGKKNFLGAFNPPVAVINDLTFLETLSDRDWIAGVSEAIKVALIKDKSFFESLKNDTGLLLRRDKEAMYALIFQCAKMHIEHIASKDPFEKGSSRPLDFGHWAAHKLEQLTDFDLRHGEAVAIGIALDVSYSYLKGMISEGDWKEIITLIADFGFKLYIPELEADQGLLDGMEEFREHLGGELTIMLLEAIGKGVEVNDMDPQLILKARDLLKEAENNRKSPLVERE